MNQHTSSSPKRILISITLLAVLVVFALAASEIRPVKQTPSENQLATKDKTTPLESQATFTSATSTYDDIMNYLDEKVEPSNQKRQEYWQRDFSSTKKYLASVEPYRLDLADLIAVPKECLKGKQPHLVSSELAVSKEDVDIYYWKLEVCEGKLKQEALVGIPKDSQTPLPVIIAIHGQCGNPERVMGLQGDDYHHQFGLSLSRTGYMVFAPLLVTKPTEKPDECFVPANIERNQLNNRGLPVGEHLTGIEVGKLISSIDHLSNKEEIDNSRIGVYGISPGGQTAFYLGALDQRLKVVIVSQYIQDRAEKLTSRTLHDALWKFEYTHHAIFPNSLNLFNDFDIASLVIPRKLFIEASTNDSRLEGAKKTTNQIKDLYSKLGLPENSVEIRSGNGSHEIFLIDSKTFLQQHL
jgi:cephalosporin-C deacetylase-like acetyl esterase